MEKQRYCLDFACVLVCAQKWRDKGGTSTKARARKAERDGAVKRNLLLLMRTALFERRPGAPAMDPARQAEYFYNAAALYRCAHFLTKSHLHHTLVWGRLAVQRGWLTGSNKTQHPPSLVHHTTPSAHT